MDATAVHVVLNAPATKKAAPRWKGPGYLPFCVKQKGCQCAKVTRLAGNGAHIEAPGCRLVKVPTIDRHIQVRLECETHRNVGGPLPVQTMLSGQPVDPRGLPDSHNTLDYLAYKAGRGPVQP